MERRDLGFVLIVLALALIALAVVFDGRLPGQASHSSLPPVRQRNLNIDDRIDRELKEADAHIRFGTARTAFENEASAPVGEPIEAISDVHTLQLKQENHAVDVLRSLEEKPARRLTPDERIRRKQERDQWVHEYDRRYEKEFVRQFQENARQQGYNIRVNENLDVTGVENFPLEKPIRVPQSVPGVSQ